MTMLLCTLWWTYKKQWKMAIEIVDFPIKNGDFPLLLVCSPEGSPFFGGKICPCFDQANQRGSPRTCCTSASIAQTSGWPQTAGKNLGRLCHLGVSENSVPHCTQWFVWSLSLFNGYFIGNVPYFQTNPSRDYPLEDINDLIFAFQVAGAW